MPNNFSKEQIKEISTEIARKFHEEAMPLVSTAELSFVLTLKYITEQFFLQDKNYANTIKLTFIKDIVNRLDMQDYITFNEENI